MNDEEQTCRVCRSGEEAGKLYSPCRCSGSLGKVHDSCLATWLQVSKGHRCEICKYPFQWEKVYASQVPSRLPVLLVIRHLLSGASTVVKWILRFILVAFVWIAVLPYIILWVWRNFFGIATAWGVAWTSVIQESGWPSLSSLLSRSIPPGSVHSVGSALAKNTTEQNITALSKPFINLTKDASPADIAAAAATISERFNKTLGGLQAIVEALDATTEPEVLASGLWKVVKSMLFINDTVAANTTEMLGPYPSEGDPWQLSGYLAYNYKKNRTLINTLASDCFSGQIIVCAVVVSFITAFLLREWVIANQPLQAADPEQQPQGQQAAVQADPAAAPIAAPAAQAIQPPQGDNGATERGIAPAAAGEEGTRQSLELSSGLSAASAPTDLIEGDSASPSTAPVSLGAQAFLERQQAREAALQQHAWSRRQTLPEYAIDGEPADNQFTSLPIATPTNVRQDDVLDAPTANAIDAPGEAPAVIGPTNRDEQPDNDEDSDSSDSDSGSDSGNEAEDRHRHGNRPARAPEVVVAPPAAGVLNNGIAAEDLAAIRAAANGEDDDIFFEADLEGILEAIGLQGPLLALLQNVALMILLITVLLMLAVLTPLMIGKTFVATNAYKILLLPLNIVRIATDPVADFLVSHLSIGKRKVTNPQAAPPRSVSTWTGVKGISDKLMSLVGLRKAPPAPSRISVLISTIQSGIRQRVSDLQQRSHAGIELFKQRWTSMATQDSTADRILSIAVGYAVFVGIAVLYLRYTRNVQAANLTRQIRDALKQQFILIKAGTFFIIEIVVFPTLCGILLNIATIPLFPGVTIMSRIQYHIHSPISAGFLTWLAGTNFMYSFAETIGVIRKCIRKGVLWFIRDPTDPDTNPLREILETPALNQAKKITRALLVYGSIVLTCFGVFPWVTRMLNIGLFPLRFDLTRPIFTVPFDLLFVLFVLPHTLGKTRPQKFAKRLLAEWCTFTARQLRLSHFMLDVRLRDEEGSHVRKTWKAWLLLKKAHDLSDDACAESASSDVVFRRDGGFARVVASDNVKIVPSRMFVRTQEDGSPLTEEGAKAIQEQLAKGPNDESKFTIVYIPPHFNTRIVLFIYLLWITSSMAIFSFLSIPLVLGRIILDKIVGQQVHDTYSLLVGLHIMLGCKWIYRRFAQSWRRDQRRVRRSSGAGGALFWSHAQVFAATGRLLGLLLTAVNAGIFLPLLVGACFHLYILSPFESAMADKPQLSLTMDWAYGLLISSLVCSVGPSLGWFSPAAWLVMLQQRLRDGLGIPFNLIIGRFNAKLLGVLLLPNIATAIAIHPSQYLNKKLGKADEPLLLDQAFTYRAALLGSLALMLCRTFSLPAKALAAKWAARVWEQEYVVRRKLRNINDPPLVDATAALPAATTAPPALAV